MIIHSVSGLEPNRRLPFITPVMTRCIDIYNKPYGAVLSCVDRYQCVTSISGINAIIGKSQHAQYLAL